ncbi:helix-turn-helix domain-containing protein [Streptomyces collinus]|uniref:helix-turn-helix domain-containing protein n=1 Tax=Streptomyces collinus TaxID=42684 RepID=UPI0039803284
MLSPRTLQRQLQAEDTSYQAVLSETREKLARRHLADRSLPTSQVACLLAYDDTNSFYRAFRRWTGLTPEAATQRRSSRPRVTGGARLGPTTGGSAEPGAAG